MITSQHFYLTLYFSLIFSTLYATRGAAYREIAAEDGKTIRTTAEHPYLAIQQTKNTEENSSASFGSEGAEFPLSRHMDVSQSSRAIDRGHMGSRTGVYIEPQSLALRLKLGQDSSVTPPQDYDSINLNTKKETSFEEDSFAAVSLSADRSSAEFNFSIASDNFLSRASSVDNNLQFQSGSVWSGRDSNPYFSADEMNSLPINLPPRSGAAKQLYHDELPNAKWTKVIYLNEGDEIAVVEERLVLLEFEYTDPDGDGIYTAEIQAPVVDGEYEIITVFDFEDPELGMKEIRLITVVDPEGYIYEREGDKETRIPGAIVSLFWLNSETKQYELWPAKEYQQENPQTTDIRGTYSFLVPEGYYYLKVEAPGYLIYDGKPFQVREGSGIHVNIELKTRYWWLKIVDWKTVLLIAVILLLLYNFYRDRMRDRIKK